MFQLEKEIEKKFCRAFSDVDQGTCFKFQTASRNGIADRTCFLDSWCFFVEFKREKGRFSKLQNCFAEIMCEQGFEVYLIDSMKKVNLFINAYRSVLHDEYGSWPPIIPGELELINAVQTT